LRLPFGRSEILLGTTAAEGLREDILYIGVGLGTLILIIILILLLT